MESQTRLVSVHLKQKLSCIHNLGFTNGPLFGLDLHTSIINSQTLIPIKKNANPTSAHTIFMLYYIVHSQFLTTCQFLYIYIYFSFSLLFVMIQ